MLFYAKLDICLFKKLDTVLYVCIIEFYIYLTVDLENKYKTL